MKMIKFTYGLLFSASLCVVLPLAILPVILEDKPGVHFTVHQDPLVKIPSGDPVRTFEVGDFAKLYVSGALHVAIRQGETTTMAGYGPKEVVESVVVKESNGMLSVGMKDVGKVMQKEPVVLVIEVPALESLDLYGASLGMAEGITSKGFVFGASGASIGQLDLRCRDLRVDLSGGSQLEVLGSATMFNVDVSGASQLEAGELSTERTTVHASGASQVRVHCSGELALEVSGASQVEYSGDPANVQENSSGMAVINKLGPPTKK